MKPNERANLLAAARHHNGLNSKHVHRKKKSPIQIGPDDREKAGSLIIEILKAAEKR